MLRLAGLVLRYSEKKVHSRKLRIQLSRVFQRMARGPRLTFPQLSHTKPQISFRQHGSRCDHSLKVRFGSRRIRAAFCKASAPT